ncbi:aldehyde dehydrogenase (NADP(+)) [Rhodococcus sp. BP-349]|uniref:aldehyde dehydrogenase (NADP(+)) n=1 Tax=unclassified Rhodococcus (in: high G+C Gram-positive bacteria) TaxID=192944 RepID=UPI001C9B82B7|nr:MULTISPECIES: aldehyde dehydrogenase (NADP(+)) [unclassified Rhodococcus (in: high G+C Gram-positive bacteria)]MBY6537278.1 aldehyde dehydrogenase (NADP(+)) [Rhodococcus sp. BP-363]MBY6541615.1 aldehyde dehydrogenase (NADP(+)) [Rhodococcus sp. BP-369]MBY6560845.1 aldehyde dehydrogenase (NADP(+)) [Rhodococcus sp. BP-370]MBY6575137.1 aldehyde dehydrogenase (NADP(+)) [Rhodococcus sp. BP-364]MBY6584438.1 aldehyde dehydrogenase (NADP(+)) [Rhodococcus sp. BP-358]
MPSTTDNTSPSGLESILQAAHEAKTELAGQKPSTRYAQLTTVADRLDSSADELVALGLAETHLPEGRLRGELRRTTMQLRMFAEEARSGRLYDARIDVEDPDFGSGPRSDIRRMNTPIGVLLNFAASNFPFAFSVAGGDTASALASGCPVIVKAHPGHPQLSDLTGGIVTDALAETDAPSGTFAVIHGQEAGTQALADDRVDVGTFTGSVRVGLLLADVAAHRTRPIPFYGELGSINPVIVTQAAMDTRGEQIIEGFVASYTLGNGQFCTKPGLVFMPAGHGLEDRLVATARSVATGPLLTASITSGFDERVRALSESVNGKVLVESESVGGVPQPGLMKVDFREFEKHHKNIRAEAFGPFAVIVEYKGSNQLHSLATYLEGSLTTSLHAEESDAELVASLLPALQAKTGRLLLNDWPTGVAVTPAQQHGGPYPSTTNPLHTAVGTAATSRFLRPVAFQAFLQDWLPAPIRDENPWQVPQSRSSTGESQSWGRRG